MTSHHGSQAAGRSTSVTTSRSRLQSYPSLPSPHCHDTSLHTALVTLGDVSQCKGFLIQFSLYFASHEGMSQQKKISHFMGLLTGKALKWTTAVWEQGGEFISMYQRFTEQFCHVFDQTLERKEAGPTPPWQLVTQALIIDIISTERKIGGHVCLLTYTRWCPPAPYVCKPKCLTPCQLVNFSHYPHHSGPGPT